MSDTPQHQLLIEQLYESENLTDALTDSSARLLLAWGEAQINHMAAFEPEQIEAATRHLRRVMRSINRLVGQHTNLSEEEIVQQLLQVVEQAGQLAVEQAAAGHNAAPDITLDTPGERP